MKILTGLNSKGVEIWKAIRGTKDGTLNVHASATTGAAVTPSDVTVLEFKSLYIGLDGDVAVEHVDGTTATYQGVLGGSVLPVAGTKVLATGTSATNIVAMNW